MNQLEGLLILLALPAVLLLAGYWLAALLSDASPAERLAFALPCGLGVLLAEVAAVNFFLPLAGPVAFACLAPALLSILLPRTRAMLIRDLREGVFEPPRGVLYAIMALFIVLLWPVIRSPSVIFYDGTSNHDSFFWVAGAEHLKRHSYMELPQVTSTQPLTNQAVALVGWNPPWGRIGAEALLALASSVIGLSPLKLYLYSTASLALVWLAVAALVLRTFVTAQPTRPALLALAALQPLFVFFHGNANLPNLLGTLCGTTLILALERLLRTGPDERPAFVAWATLLVLSLHGMLCSYPEIVPFILLPCGLLWLRHAFRPAPARWSRAGAALGLAIVGFALNPATTIRAYQGFLASFSSARADASWANLFQPLDLAEYIPGLATLSVSGAKELDLWLGLPLSVLLVVAGMLTIRRARDPLGLLAGLSGAAALLAYTLLTGFAYGWQKTAQFGGIFIAVLFPAGAINTLWLLHPWPVWRRRLQVLAVAAVGIFFAYATVMNCRDTYKWSDRKVISSDWYALRQLSYGDLNGAPVLVEAASFRMAFFHGMWAAYFLPESRIFYGARGDESGGYLRNYVINEATRPIPPPRAILVGRTWAETFDANSPRLLAGREFALLSRSNRVFKLSGVTPTNGPPDYANAAFDLEIEPHRASTLALELRPRNKSGWPAGEWVAVREVDGLPAWRGVVNGASPWQLRIPLVAGQHNRVHVSLTGRTGAPDELSFGVRRLVIEDAP